MNKKRLQLAQRRERLVVQASVQRAALAENIEPWRTPLALADQGLSVLRYIRRNPEWITGVVVLIAAIGPRRAGKWLGRGWMTWQVIHKLRGR
jgi:hypothetical protein